MIIRTLNLVAFGKFQDKTIQISEGLNLIFGWNEAGKTTVQHFIEGMFFGFYKPYRKKRTFSDDYYRFKPRNSNRYFGTLVYEDDNGKSIRLERDFLKGRDGVRIIDNVTGDDISNIYPYDPVTKQYLPLGYGDFNSVRYNNTVNVKQMASKSDSHLAKEVNNQLLEMAGDSTDDFSIRKILDYIQAERESIGSIGKSKSNYGKTVREIEELKKTLSESEKAYAQVLSNQNLIRQYKDRIEQAQEKCLKFQSQMNEEAHQKKAELDSKLQDLRDEIDDIQNYLDEVALHQDADHRTFGEIQVLESSCQAIDRHLEEIEDQISLLSAQKAEAEDQYQQLDDCFSKFSRKEIEQDYFNYCFMLYDDNAEEANQTLGSQLSEITESDTVNLGSINNFALVVGILAGLLIAVLGFSNPGQLLSMWVQGFVGFMGLLLFAGSLGCVFLKRKGNTASKRSHSQSDGTSPDDLESDNTELASKKAAIIRKYGLKNEKEYFNFVERCSRVFNDYEDLVSSQDQYDNSLALLEKEKEKLNYDKMKYIDMIDQILADANVDSIEAYSQICEENDNSKLLQSKLEADQRLYDELSQREVVPQDAARTFYYSEQDGETINLQDAIDAFTHEKDRLIGENQLILKCMTNPVAIREKIETLQQQVEKYSLELKACDMAENFFSGYFKKVHYHLAPDLNLTIGSLIYQITGKYSEVRVDDQMNVRVLDPDSGTLLGMEQLSGGTIDQIYLALRFGVADIFDKSKSMPLLLDDPFVQYDDNRKAEAVKMLSDLSEKKQILLFTCTGDEKRILDENNYPYIGIGL